MKLDKPYFLYSTCKIVRGFSRSLLYDIHRYKLHYIPNDLHDILINFEGKSINETILFFGENSREIIIEYFEFLFDKNLIHFCEIEEFKYFSKELYNWDSPSIITNAVVEYDGFYDFSNVLLQLEKLGCYYINFIINKPLNKISDLLGETLESNFRSFDLIIEDNNYNKEDIKLFLKKNLRIRQIILYNSNKEGIIMGSIDGEGEIIYTKKNLVYTNKYQKPLKSFVFNKQFFYESKEYNTYFNRKVAINHQGKIKNCLSLDKSYGNVTECEIKEVINNPLFQEIWFINKDKVEECQDCEHRYICLDGRIPVKDNDKWIYQNKCDYNPYNATWKNEKYSNKNKVDFIKKV